MERTGVAHEMRLLLLVCLLSCGGYRTRPPAHVAEPGCTIEGTLIDIGGDAANAPVVIAYVHHSFMPSDVVALWSDGSMVMSRDHELVQGSVAAADATRVAREVVAGIARSPDYAELPGPTDMPRVELFARDGDRWRHAFVWGASPARYGRAPDGFVAAYRALLALRPATTSPFQPAEIELTYEPAEPGAPPVVWPADVPQPSAENRSQIVDAHYDAQLRALITESRGHTPPRPVAFADRTWRIAIARRFRGQSVIDTVRECARRAEHSSSARLPSVLSTTSNFRRTSTGRHRARPTRIGGRKPRSSASGKACVPALETIDATITPRKRLAATLASEFRHRVE